MKGLCVVAIACIALLATEGCRRPKREPVPGPQSRILGISAATFGITSHKLSGSARRGMHQSLDADPTGMDHGAVGIAWFQGSVDEAFSKARARHDGASSPHTVPMCPGSMSSPDHLRRGASPDDDA